MKSTDFLEKEKLCKEAREFLKSLNMWRGFYKVVSPEILVVVTSGQKYEWFRGGVAGFQTLTVWNKGKIDSKTYCHRDQYNPDLDRPDLCMHDIASIEMTEEKIIVELHNYRYGNRLVTFESI